MGIFVGMATCRHRRRTVCSGRPSHPQDQTRLAIAHPVWLLIRRACKGLAIYANAGSIPPSCRLPHCLALPPLGDGRSCARLSGLSAPWRFPFCVVCMTDLRSEEAAAYRKLYRTARWRRLRERQLAHQPLCQWCLELDTVEPATEVHHLIAHRGDLDLFWSGPFLSTCTPCHATRGQREDRGQLVQTFGADGWPVDG